MHQKQKMTQQKLLTFLYILVNVNAIWAEHMFCPHEVQLQFPNVSSYPKHKDYIFTWVIIHNCRKATIYPIVDIKLQWCTHNIDIIKLNCRYPTTKT